MPRLVKAACPHCGAGVTLDPTRDVVSCTFCGTSSFIQRPRRAPTEPIPVAPQGMPTIVMPEVRPASTSALVVVPIVLVLVLAGVGAAIAFSGKAGGGRYSVGGRPLPLDANGDGVEDIVLDVTTLGKTPQLHFAAFDPQSGKELWRTPSLGASGEANHATTARGRLVVTVRNAVFGFDGKSGTQAFATALPELPEALCKHPSGVAVLTKDKQLFPVDLGNGALGAPTAGARYAQEKGTRCVDLDPADASQGPGLIEVDEAPYRDRVKGMQVSDVFAIADTKQVLVLGTREPGTRVPMLAAFDGEKLLWVQELPVSEPLLAKEGEPTAFAVASGRVLAAYERSDRQELRIVCFDFHSGRRAWEAALPERDFFTSFGITDRYVVVRGFSKAWTFALADGKDLAVISGL